MRTITRRRFLQSATALASTSVVARIARAAAGPLAVVVGKGSRVTGISRVELKRLFLGTPVTIAGEALVAFNAPVSSPERLLFERAVLEMTPDQVTKTWVDLRIRAQAKPPRTAPGTDVLLKLAAAFPGAICYVPLAAVNGAVKVIPVDGKRPGDPEYVLAL